MSDMMLKVNGKKIPLTEFPEEFITNTMIGMLSTLKGVGQIKAVELSFSIDE